MSLEAAVAVSRFGFGASPGELAKIGSDGRGYLKAQLRRSDWLAAPADLPSAAKYLSSLPGNLKDLPLEQKVAILNRAYLINYAEIAYRMAAGVKQPDGLRERLAWFWSNHFTVSATNRQALAFLGAMEREAIRPHVTGKFADMLKAVTRHPAMLIYLDNVTNIGPSSRAGNFTGKGLNENLAREILELHTLGVDGGYTQADVTSFAKVLTGWSIAKAGDANGGNAFQYFPNRHEPGAKVVLGKSYESGDGEQEGIDVLEALARHPSTAKFIAAKLAKHFYADQPNPESVARLARAFHESNGDLGVVSAALLDDPAAWSPEPVKFRPPGEFVVTATRGVMLPLGDQLLALADQALSGELLPKDVKGARQPTPAIGVVASTRIMGQFPWTAPSPKGWSDDNSAWISSDPVIERVEWCSQVGAKIPLTVAPVDVAQNLLGERLSKQTRQAIELAASPAQGLGLMLASPEFQKR